MLGNPKKPTRWEFINVTTALSFDLAVYLMWGPSALGFLLLSSVLGSGMHPVAGHFIAEHYVFVKGVETYSYYGWLYIFAFNVGYHNEYHNFPFIPGSRLPWLRATASELYDELPQHEAWTKVLVDYIMDPEVAQQLLALVHALHNPQQSMTRTSCIDNIVPPPRIMS
jgi:sphingolipid delta-4 desaturase